MNNKGMAAIIAAIFSLIFGNAHAQFQDFNYGRELTIDNNSISGTGQIIDFPVYFHFNDSELRSVTYGGNVSNDSGKDIIFISRDCQTQYDHQIEKYDPTTGELSVWVRLTLDPSSTNELLMLYNSTSASNTETDELWKNGFSNVYHFNATLDTTDMTGNGLHGTNYGSDLYPSGKLNGGRYFNNTTDYVEVSTDSMSATNGTVSAWVYPDSISENVNSQYIFGHTTQPAWGNRIQFFMNDQVSSGGLYAGMGNHHFLMEDTSAIEDTTWYYATLSWQRAEGIHISKMYLNGVLLSTDTVIGLNVLYPTADIGNNGEVGTSTVPHGQGFNGVIDEFHVSNVMRNDHWIMTAYNNQNDPVSFASIGAETSYAELCTAALNDLAENGLEIYPNPASDVITIKGKDVLEQVRLEIFNVTGQKVLSMDFGGENMSMETVDISMLSEGTYFVNVIMGTSISINRLVLKK